MTATRIDGWPRLMTVKTAADYLDCSDRMIEKLQSEGKLIPVKSDAGKRFTREELDKYSDSLEEWER